MNKKYFIVFTVIMAYFMFFQSKMDFELHSERFPNSMISAGIINLSADDSVFGLRLLELDDVTYDSYGGINGKQADNDVINFLYNCDRIASNISSIKFVKTREQQLGIQGWIAYFIGKLHNYLPIAPKYFRYVLRGLSAIAFSVVIVLICFELVKAYNTLFGISFFIAILLSGEMRNFAPNMYWCSFAWFLPMLFGLKILNNLEGKNMSLYFCMFFSILFKCACGYEYLTSVFLGATVFLLVEGLDCWKSNAKKARTAIMASVLTFLVCMSGFVVVFGLNAYFRGNHDVIEGAKQIYEQDVKRRTFGNSKDFKPVYADSLNASVAKVLFIYLFKNSTGILASLITLAIIITYFQEKKRKIEISRKDMLLLVTSFVCSISWFVLAKSHSFIHRELNCALWYLPYIPVALYILVNNLLKLHGKDIDYKLLMI